MFLRICFYQLLIFYLATDFVLSRAGKLQRRGGDTRVSHSECNLPEAERIDCGYHGIKVEECQSRGCCWNPSEVPGVNWCYHSNKHAVEECLSVGGNREDCGYYGISSHECLKGGCCWMPTQEQGAPWCFYSAEPALGSCGVPAVMPSVNTRIVGGVTATPHSWPWQISFTVGGEHNCGGSLINERWVLSAAHCEITSTHEPIQIVLGAHNKDIQEDTTVSVDIEQQLTHPEWDSFTLDNDIMLIKLAEPVTYSDAISTVCLPPAGKQLASGDIVQTSGWGTLELFGDSPSELQQLTMNVYDNQECRESGQHYSKEITDNMICAGYMTAGQASCHGDSGGPMVKLVDGRWTLFGVVSWGYPCAEADHPTLYAKVINYLDWIKNTTTNNS